MKRLNQHNKGFTIIELLIATVTFSVVLLVITSAIIQIGRIYYKGVVQARVQERTRTITEDISQTIQFSRTDLAGNQITTATGIGHICVGNKVYTYNKGVRLDSTHRVLVEENGSSCTPYGAMNPPLAALGDRVELVGDGMQLLDISVQNIPSGSDLYQIKVRLAYGQTSDMQDTNGDTIMDRCKPISLGGQFCAISELTTNVSSRFK